MPILPNIYSSLSLQDIHLQREYLKTFLVSSGIEEIMVSSQLNSELIFVFNYLCYCAVCMSV